METLKSLSSKALSAVKGNLSNMSKPITAVVVGYMVLLVVLILSYYLAWLYNALHGTIALKDLYTIIHELTGTSMIACITFIGGCFVDIDDNGIPDAFEKNNNNNREVK